MKTVVIDVNGSLLEFLLDKITVEQMKIAYEQITKDGCYMDVVEYREE